MAAEDWIGGEDPWDIDDGRMEVDGEEPLYEMFAQAYKQQSYKRKCVKCDWIFKAALPCACPTCGGWTDKI